MHVPEQVARFCQDLASDKQAEVLDVVEFLISRQAHTPWTVEQRREVVARTMGSLHETWTSAVRPGGQRALHKPLVLLSLLLVCPCLPWFIAGEYGILSAKLP